MLKLRNFATWITMSSLVVVVANARLAILPDMVVGSLFALFCIGVWVATGAQICIGVSCLLRLTGLAEALKDWGDAEGRAELDRYQHR